MGITRQSENELAGVRDMIIYKIENRINNKIYIGQTIYGVNQRILGHLKAKSYIGSALRKYGIESFNILVIDYTSTKEMLDEREKYWIEVLGSKFPNGYNLTDGGEGTSGFTMPEGTKEKLRVINLGKHLSESTKQKISDAGKNNYTDERRRKVSEANKGKIISEEHKKIISRCRKGQVMSEEQKNKIRKSLLGRPSPIKGIKRPEYSGENNPAKRPEVRKKLSNSMKGRTSPKKGLHLSEEHKNNISKSRKGHSVSEETRQKIRSKLLGVKLPGRTGRKRTEEMKRRMSEGHKNKKL
jgi:group I intron endonuclease